MHQRGSKMVKLWAVRLGWLICSFIAVCEPVFGTNADPNCNRKTCDGTMYDSREAVCCGKQPYSGAGLSYCGNQTFNPATATCCTTGHGHIFEAKVTKGLSAKVSACCGLEAFNKLNEICCESKVVAKPSAVADCCGKEAYDKHKQLCCGPKNHKVTLVKNSTDHRCCGHNQYNIKTQRCCWKNQTHAEAQLIGSPCQDDLYSVLTSRAACGLTTYNKVTELCCDSTVIDKPSPKAECCGKEAYDVKKKLCCGPLDDKRIVVMESSDHRCCHHGQYNLKSECCYWKNDTFAERKPKNSLQCYVNSGGQHQKLGPQPKCIEPNTHLCGSLCYNPNERRCCERKETKAPWCCASGQCDAAPTVYNPQTHVCCVGCVSELKPGMDQCCGDTPYGSAQRGVLCCQNILYKERGDGEECSDTAIPYNPAKRTICCSQFHGSPGQHCCGTEVYRPHDDICCGGHRYPKEENLHCCGVNAYNIRDPEMKCCAGTLYNLTSHHKGDVKCCGSALQNPQEVCCSSKDEVVLYSRKMGFGCCGHLQFSLSLWSCHAERLIPEHQPRQQQSKMTESRLQSVNNLNEAHLCTKIYIGIVKSVTLNSIVFSSVLKLHGRNATVQPEPFYDILTYHRNAPKLILGKFYFFSDTNVFADFNHDNVLESLYFIFNKCSP